MLISRFRLIRESIRWLVNHRTSEPVEMVYFVWFNNTKWLWREINKHWLNLTLASTQHRVCSIRKKAKLTSWAPIRGTPGTTRLITPELGVYSKDSRDAERERSVLNAAHSANLVESTSHYIWHRLAHSILEQLDSSFHLQKCFSFPFARVALNGQMFILLISNTDATEPECALK